MLDPADFVQKQVQHAQKKFGDLEVYTADAHVRTNHGVPIPCIPLQYLLTTNVIPCERMGAITGPYGSCKSTLAFEFIRFFLDAGGYANIIDSENKLSTKILEEVIGAEYMQSRVILNRAANIEDMSAKVIEGLKYYFDKATDGEKDAYPLRKLPHISLLDSLSGPPAQATQATVTKEGAQGRGYSDKPIVIQNMMSSINPFLIGSEAAFIYTNHEKDDLSAAASPGFGGPKKRNPGGDGPDFYKTYQIRATVAKDLPERTNKNAPGKLLKLKTEKNSNGPKRDIFVEVRWITEEQVIATPDGEETVERTVCRFNWDQSLAMLLAADHMPKDKLKDVLTVKAQTSTKYDCPQLNMKNVHPTELGAAIHADEDLCDELRKILGIDMWSLPCQ
jgi:hypothetical protein